MAFFERIFHLCEKFSEILFMWLFSSRVHTMVIVVVVNKSAIKGVKIVHQSLADDIFRIILFSVRFREIQYYENIDF